MQHVEGALTFPIPASLNNSTNRTHDRAQKDVDTLRPGLEADVPGSVVCQLLVPTRGDMYTTRKCAYIVCGAHTVSGVCQTQTWEA